MELHYVPIGATVSTMHLVLQLVSYLEYDQLIQFVMDLDAQVADYDFTVQLHEALGEEIRNEDEGS